MLTQQLTKAFGSVSFKSEDKGGTHVLRASIREYARAKKKGTVTTADSVSWRAV